MDIAVPCIWAFVIGGAFCVIAQLLIDCTRLTPARILVIYVCAGVLLYAVGLFEPLHELAGAGASVPLVGFGANVGKGVREAVDSQGLIGIFTGSLAAASGGISAALCFGYSVALIFKSKPKNL